MGLIRLSTSGPKGRSKKAPQKPNAQQRALAAAWEKIQTDHAKPLEKGTGKPVVTVTGRIKENYTPPFNELPRESGNQNKAFSSKVTVGADTTVKPTTQYTGNAMIGLGQLHKSNLVPVFKQEDAIDIARMRR